MAQYEDGIHTPKVDLTKVLSDALDVPPFALRRLDCDSHFGILHTLFALCDCYGLSIEIKGGRFVSKLILTGKRTARHSEQISAWASIAEKNSAEGIGRNKYDKWRYYSHEYDDTKIMAKVLFQELSDAMVKVPKDWFKD